MMTAIQIKSILKENDIDFTYVKKQADGKQFIITLEVNYKNLIKLKNTGFIRTNLTPYTVTIKNC